MSEVIQLTVLTESSNFLFLFQFPTKPASSSLLIFLLHSQICKTLIFFLFPSLTFLLYLFVNCDFLSLFSPSPSSSFLSLFFFFSLSLSPLQLFWAGWIKLILNTQMFSIPLKLYNLKMELTHIIYPNQSSCMISTSLHCD